MKIDWKHVAQTKGYLSIKKAMKDLNEYRWTRPSDIAASKKIFINLINRAKHYAYIKEVTLDAILDYWEAKRLHTKHEWRSFYGSYHLPKKLGNSMKPTGTRHMLAYMKKHNMQHHDKHHTNQQISIHLIAQRKASGKRARWTPDYKARVAKDKYLEEKYASM